jgi:hypothetical protein
MTATPEVTAAEAAMNSARASLPVTEITIFQKAGGPLTKQISFSADGSLKSDGSQCVMPRGSARRCTFSTMEELAARIYRFGSDEALALGSLRTDLPDGVRVVTKSKLNGADQPGIIARTQDYLIFRPGQPAIVLVDFDTKGMPPSVAAKLEELGGFWPTLVSVIPEMTRTARVERASTSAGLYDSRTGEKFSGPGGLHVYPLIKDGADSERFLKTLHERCWLAGLGWMMVGASGQLLERSIVDRVCGTPERLAFEGRPVLSMPLAQDLAARQPTAVEGEALDTITACRPLTIVELAKLRELRAREAHRLASQSAKAREVFIDWQSRRLVDRTSMDWRRARRTIERQCEGVLLPDIELPLDDDDLAGTTVADVLADPARFEGETLADPHEGVEYGRCKAKIMRRADGAVWINSFAHGRTVYELRLDFSAAKAVLEKSPKDEAADTLVRLVLGADLEEDEAEELRNIASERSGITKTTLGRKLKRAQRDAREQRAQQDRDRRIAKRRDPRPQISLPAPTAEWLPQMQLLNDVLRDAPTAMRNTALITAQVHTKHIPSLHLLTTKEVNP